MSGTTPLRRRRPWPFPGGSGTVWLAGTIAGVVGLVSAWGGAPRTAQADEVSQQACCPEEMPDAGFADVTGSAHRRAVDCAVWYGLAKGVGEQTYAPGQRVRRDQMATFVSRLLETAGVELPHPADQGFGDLDGNPHSARINQLADLGVVQGVREGVYAPARGVRRDQMASLLVRGYELLHGEELEAPESGFDDVRGNPHRTNIDKAAAAGFAQGVGPARYRPGEQVRRDQMASFLARAVIRGVAEGHIEPLQPDGGGPETSPPEGNPSAHDYMGMLERWPGYAEAGFTDGHRGHGGLGYFGGGGAVEQGMRSLGNFIYVYATLAVDDRYDPAVSGVPQSQVEAHAKKALRYMTRTHVTGDVAATDGRQWGDQWQSSWWTSRMAGGAHLLWDRLSSHERGLVRRVVTFEADRQVRRDPPSRVQGNTAAEENAWDTEALAWALALFPDHPHAAQWRTALNRWAMNSLSVRGDRDDPRRVEGRAISEWNETVNVHDDFTIENHGGYHAGYMTWPLQSLAWSYYALASADQPVPATLLHHYRDVWERLRSTYLGDGRFAYLGGKDWPRYAYGLYAVLPPAMLMQHLHDDQVARTVEADRVETLRWEQQLWDDGGFFTGRFTGDSFEGWSPEYESDTAAMLAMVSRLGGVIDTDERPAPLADDELSAQLAGSVVSPKSRFVTARDDGLFTAFSWKTLECCVGVGGEPHEVLGLVMPGDPHMVEWAQGQLAGTFSIKGVGAQERGVRWHDIRRLSGGGYATLGERWFGDSAEEPRLTQQLAMVSVPGLNRALVLDTARATKPVAMGGSSALDLHLTNDIFNESERRIHTQGEQRTVPGATDGQIDLRGPWVNVDDRLGVAYDGSAGSLRLQARGHRNLPWNSLRSETVRWSPADPGRIHDAGETVRQLAFGFHAGGHDETRGLADQMGVLATSVPDVNAAWLAGSADGTETTVLAVANFSGRARSVTVDVREVPAFTQPELERRVPSRSVDVLRSP